MNRTPPNPQAAAPDYRIAVGWGLLLLTTLWLPPSAAAAVLQALVQQSTASAVAWAGSDSVEATPRRSEGEEAATLPAAVTDDETERDAPATPHAESAGELAPFPVRALAEPSRDLAVASPKLAQDTTPRAPLHRCPTAPRAPPHG